MANHKSAIKAHKQSLTSRARNLSILSRVKSFIKKFENSLSAKKFDDARNDLKLAESEIMKAVSKGVYKLNTASRKVSRFTKKIKTLETK